MGLLSGLGTVGAAYLVTQKSGPFRIFDRLRSLDNCMWRCRKYHGDSVQLVACHKQCLADNHSGPILKLLFTGQLRLFYHMLMYHLTSFIASIFGCPFCFGPYAAFVIIGYLWCGSYITLYVTPLLWLCAVGINNIFCDLLLKDTYDVLG